MIPPVILESSSSYGEIQVFNKLKNEPGSKDWIVLHSLDLPVHIRQVAGEIDFVVIVPNKGILCIEVKGCAKLTRKDGMWFYGQDRVGDSRGPFKQVREGMHSLRKRLTKERPEFSRIPFFTAVIFPQTPFSDKTEEWHDWEVIDFRRFRAAPLSTNILSILEKWRSYIQESPSNSWFSKDSTEPYPQQCDQIADYLRGDFEKHEEAKSIVERNLDELDRFTKEQFDALDSMEANDRIIFSGAAGTGKTYLALEAAKRADLHGKKALFVCFNKNLADWLKEKNKVLKNVEITTIHSLMMKLAGVSVSEDTPYFWEQTLPEQAQAAIINSSTNILQYDLLIIDEGQDLLHAPYIDFLDLLIRGGFSGGYWRMFGDFINQRIYRTGNLKLSSFKNNICGGVPEFKLTVNCRNTPRVGTWAEKLGQLDPGYSRFRRPDSGVEPELIFYKKGTAIEPLLLKELDKLETIGFQNKDIVILSPYSGANSAISLLQPGIWKDRIKPFKQNNPGYVSFTTIHSFKGLESQVVVITDFDKLSSDEEMSLLYVAISRAIYKVILFLEEPLKDKIFEIVMKKGIAK